MAEINYCDVFPWRCDERGGRKRQRILSRYMGDRNGDGRLRCRAPTRATFVCCARSANCGGRDWCGVLPHHQASVLNSRSTALGRSCEQQSLVSTHVCLFVCALDKGGDHQGVIALTRARLLDVMRVMICVIWCVFHQQQLIVGKQLRIMDSWST